MVTMEDVDDFGGKFGLLPQVGLIKLLEKTGKKQGNLLPSGKLSHFAMERSTMFNGKISTISITMFNSKLSAITRLANEFSIGKVKQRSNANGPVVTSMQGTSCVRQALTTAPQWHDQRHQVIHICGGIFSSSIGKP